MGRPKEEARDEWPQLSPPWKTGTRDPSKEQDCLPSPPPHPSPPQPHPPLHPRPIPLLQWLDQTKSRLCPQWGQHGWGRGQFLRSQGQGVKPAAEKFVASALSYLPRPHPVPPTGQPSSSCPAPPPFSIWKKEPCCLCILTVAKRLNCLRAGSLGWLDEPGRDKDRHSNSPLFSGLRPPGCC